MTKEEHDKLTEELFNLKQHTQQMFDRLVKYRQMRKKLDRLYKVRSSIGSNIRHIEVYMAEVDDFAIDSRAITDELTQAIGNALDKVIAEKEEALRDV